MTADGEVAANADVPAWVRALVGKYAGKCPQVTASLLAAQLYTESHFDAKAKSPVGALGIAQFMPGTWSVYGVDGDGVKDVFNPADAVAAQAGYNCVPPYSETRNYVKAIRDLSAKWAAGSASSPAGKGASAAIAAAKTTLGSWYQWGGDCAPPCTGQNGCDCSSLTKMAWSHAGVNLPRVTYDQVHAGTAVRSISQLQPGDLLFSVPGASGPEHVGMYIGDDQVIEAPHTGARVRIKPLSFWAPQVIAMRHIG